MASGSGLDPDITLQNAEFRLERVAAEWADDTRRNVADVRKAIDEILRANASTAFGGLAGEKLVNVLRSQFGTLQTLRIVEIGFK